MTVLGIRSFSSSHPQDVEQCLVDVLDGRAAGCRLYSICYALDRCAARQHSNKDCHDRGRAPRVPCEILKKRVDGRVRRPLDLLHVRFQSSFVEALHAHRLEAGKHTTTAQQNNARSWHDGVQRDVAVVVGQNGRHARQGRLDIKGGERRVLL